MHAPSKSSRPNLAAIRDHPMRGVNCDIPILSKQADMPLRSACFSPIRSLPSSCHLRRLHRKLEEKFAYRAASWEGRREGESVVHEGGGRGRSGMMMMIAASSGRDGGEFQQRQKGDRQSTFTVGGEMAGTRPLEPAATGATGKECRSTFTASPSWHL